MAQAPRTVNPSRAVVEGSFDSERRFAFHDPRKPLGALPYCLTWEPAANQIKTK